MRLPRSNSCPSVKKGKAPFTFKSAHVVSEFSSNFRQVHNEYSAGVAVIGAGRGRGAGGAPAAASWGASSRAT